MVKRSISFLVSLLYPVEYRGYQALGISFFVVLFVIFLFHLIFIIKFIKIFIISFLKMQTFM